MAIGILYRRMEFAFPPVSEPSWHALVDRWYQLDAPAYGLCEAVMHWKGEWKVPDRMIFASPGASNVSDLDFVRSGTTSPAKFVHTLPNVRASALAQVMEWNGPTVCLQRDPMTFLSALVQAGEWIGVDCPVAWVVGVFSNKEVHHWELHRARTWERYPFWLGNDDGMEENDDGKLLDWLGHSDDGLTKRFRLPYGYFLARNV